MKRVLLAALLGAIGMFIWMSIAHMATSLGTMGISEIPNEAPVLAAMHDSIGNQGGLYLFPGAGLNQPRAEQREAMKHYQEKLDANPSGLLIYHAPGARMLAPSQLAIEFITEFLEAFFASLLLARAALGSYGRRVAFVLTIGIVAVIVTNVPYWNWYGFPAVYTIGAMFTGLIGFLILGLIAGKVLKNV
ncbi:MAG TPA: hypothetical protein VGL89_06910 [Candidatus Koribacter sp.]|jgi:hypothetical protein